MGSSRTSLLSRSIIARCGGSCWPTTALSILAPRMRKVFSFADALGYLGDFSRARLDSAVARPRAHEEIAGHATGHDRGAAHALRFDHGLAMVCRGLGGLARLGAPIHRLEAWFDHP